MNTIGKLLNWFEIGRGMVLGRITNLLSVSLMVATYMTVRGFDFGLLELFGLAFGLGIAMLVSGIVWTKIGFWSKEQSSRNQLNPEVMQTLANTKKILKKLELKE